MCRKKLEIMAAARSLSVRGQPMRHTERPASSSHCLDRWASVRAMSGLQPEVRPHRAVQVHDQLAAGREAEAVPGERRGRRALDDPPVLVEAAAVTGALEPGGGPLDVAA